MDHVLHTTCYILCLYAILYDMFYVICHILYIVDDLQYLVDHILHTIWPIWYYITSPAVENSPTFQQGQLQTIGVALHCCISPLSHSTPEARHPQAETQCLGRSEASCWLDRPELVPETVVCKG